MSITVDKREGETSSSDDFRRRTAEAPYSHVTDKRGPLRPERLTPVRDRISGAALVRTFQNLDRLTALSTCLVVVLLVGPGRFLQGPTPYTIPLIVAVVVTLWAMSVLGGYLFTASERVSLHLLRVIGAVAMGGAAARLTAGGLGAVPVRISELWTAVAVFGFVISHLWALRVVSQARRDGHLTPNLVIVGATHNAETLVQQALAARHVNILGIFDDRSERSPANLLGVPVLGTVDELPGHKIIPFIDRIVLTVPPSAEARVSQIVERLKFLPNALTLYVDVRDGSARTLLARLADAPLHEQGGLDLQSPGALSKRVQDVVISLAGLMAVGPIMLLVALAVRLDSPGPVLFRQRRHGFNNEVITILKFRSMRNDKADQNAHQQIRANDDRVTKVGAFIRRTSLDELPQLLNVLSGEMSMVGPRPHAIGMRTGDEESARLVAEYAWRHRMKPGITGWAQINGSRGPVDTPEAIRQRVTYDLEYIERQSLWFDLYIIAMTIPRLLGDKSAVR
jgi:Undecaprenyl-phosphate glucose phosphotransferase